MHLGFSPPRVVCITAPTNLALSNVKSWLGSCTTDMLSVGQLDGKQTQNSNALRSFADACSVFGLVFAVLCHLTANHCLSVSIQTDLWTGSHKMLAARRRMARSVGAVARMTAPMACAPLPVLKPVASLKAQLPPVVAAFPASRRMMSSSPAWVEHPDQFHLRHNGILPHDEALMCKVLGVKDIHQLMDETVPKSIRNRPPLAVGKALTETEALKKLQDMVSTNAVNKTYIGMGYYNTITPPPILRNIIQNPGWYTPYTPYQAEISQGRMESLVNYQTMISDLTGMKIAQASLLVSNVSLRLPRIFFN